MDSKNFKKLSWTISKIGFIDFPNIIDIITDNYIWFNDIVWF